MQQVLRAVMVAFAAVALVHFAGAASAQAPMKQIRLTEKQVQGFIAAQKDMVMGGIDPQSKQYVDPQTAIKKEMAEVAADKTIPEKEKKDLLKELEEALTTAQSVQYPSNIELVRKYYDKIDPAL